MTDIKTLLTRQPTVTFQNPGLIDMRAVQFMGVNAKASDHPIGYFGTGLKYAIAVLLRSAHSITIWRGLDRYQFTSRLETIRGKPFSLIYMNDQPLGITTDLGKNWLMWMAYRELHSNVLDEAGSIFPHVQAPHPDMTTIQVEGQDFFNAYQKRGEIFLQSTPILSTPMVEIHQRKPCPFFYRGIAAGKSQRNHMFSYNVLAESALTEDRTLVSSVMIDAHVAAAIMGSSNKELIRTFLLANKDSYEYNCDMNWMDIELSPEFIETIETMLARVNPSARARYLALNPLKSEYEEVTNLTARESTIITKAMTFLTKLDVDSKYPIKVYKDLGEGTMGMASAKTIMLARRTLEMGIKQTVSTIYEEYIHLDRGYADHSYEMQNFLFDKIISLTEELSGDVL